MEVNWLLVSRYVLQNDRLPRKRNGITGCLYGLPVQMRDIRNCFYEPMERGLNKTVKLSYPPSRVSIFSREVDSRLRENDNPKFGD